MSARTSRPVRERGHADVHDVEPVHEVFAELACGQGGGQVLVGGRDDPHVEVHSGPVGAHRLDLAVFEEPQEHGLHPEAHLGDFVEEDRAVVRLLQQAHLVAERVGEAPFTWPKSCDSSSVSGTPAQLTATKGCLARWEWAWMSWAMRSLPTPLSPVMRTFASPHATRSASAQIAWIAALRPMMTGATDPSAGSGDALEVSVDHGIAGGTKVIGPSAGILQERGTPGALPGCRGWGLRRRSVSKIHLRGALSRPGLPAAVMGPLLGSSSCADTAAANAYVSPRRPGGVAAAWRVVAYPNRVDPLTLAGRHSRSG